MAAYQVPEEIIEDIELLKAARESGAKFTDCEESQLLGDLKSALHYEQIDAATFAKIKADFHI